MLKKKSIMSLIAASNVFAISFLTADCGECCDNWAAGASFLYWNASADAPPMVETLTFNGDVTHTSTARILANLPMERWTSGFKVFAGYLPVCGWGYKAEYTYWKNSNNSSYTAPSELVPLVSPWLVAPVDTSISGSWYVKLQNLDLLTQRTFWLGDCNYITPYAGLRFVNLDHTITVTGSDTGLGNSGTKSKLTSWGVAPAFGARLGHLFCNCMDLYLEATADIGYRHINNSLDTDYEHEFFEEELNIIKWFSTSNTTSVRF